MKSLLYKYPIKSSIVITIITFIMSIYLINQAGLYYGLLIQMPAIVAASHILDKGRNITILKRLIVAIFIMLIYSIALLYVFSIIRHSN
ncbi:hypothetical protein [Clostridium sp.]|uniref:hypothetical protein n=1 Tax=Clostridium sp. TaxID=1506 RepID=UPI003F4B0153